MWLLLLALAQASVVDRVTAVVGAEVVLASDRDLDRDLSQFDPTLSPFWSRPLGARPVEAALVRTAAGDIPLYQPSDEAVRERLVALRAAAMDHEPWAELLARWGLDEPSLTAALRRRMVVEAYLLRNLQADPADPAWNQACDALIAQLAERIRIRRVPH